MYITLTKKRLFVILCAAVAVFLCLTQFISVKAEGVKLSTNAQRVEYIKTLGVTLISDEYTKKNIVIPQDFNDVYSKYNRLQKSAGFDLSNYRGKTVTVYTYNCEQDKAVSLMIFENRLIGGDVAETKLHGSMTALRR